MKKFLILLMVFVSLTMPKEIKIDEIYKSVQNSNESVLKEEAKTFCKVYNDTAKKQFRCYYKMPDRLGRYKIQIKEYNCPHILPAPLAQYFTSDSIYSLDFHRWAETCAEIQNFDVHYLNDRRIEFIKIDNDKIKIIKNNITFTENKCKKFNHRTRTLECCKEKNDQ